MQPVFLHIPKTGGNSIMSALGLPGAYQGHVRLRNLRRAPDDFLFTFVRNPWDRLVSAWHYLKAGGINQQDRRDAQRYLARHGTFRDFLRDLDPSAALFREQIHCMPQMHYIEDVPAFSFIGRFERLQDDFSRLCEKLRLPDCPLRHANASQRHDYQVYYDTKSIELVGQIYHLDIEHLAYAFDE